MYTLVGERLGWYPVSKLAGGSANNLFRADEYTCTTEP